MHVFTNTLTVLTRESSVFRVTNFNNASYEFACLSLRAKYKDTSKVAEAKSLLGGDRIGSPDGGTKRKIPLEVEEFACVAIYLE